MAESKGLAEYVVGDLFTWMKDERQTILEPQWRRNYDAFRSRYNSDNLMKWRAMEGNKWRSKVFCRLTKQKVMTGFNHVSALMLQQGRMPLTLSPTPVPESSPGVIMAPEDASLRAGQMERRIHDDWVQCRAAREYMTGMLEGAVYGLTWMRGPFLKPFERLVPDFGLPVDSDMYFPPDLVRRFGQYSMRRERIMRPVMESPSVWNMFWDLEAADHQKGHGVVYLEMMSKGRFSELITREGYDEGAGRKLLDAFKGEGGDDPDADALGPLRDQYNLRKRVIPVYTFWGRVPVKYLRAYGLGDGKKDTDELEVYLVCAKAGTPVVIRRPVLNPLPYRQIFMASWQELPHEPGGVGIPEDIEDTQMVINGLTRAMLDNKQLSSNLMSWWNPRHLAPGQDKTMYPGKSFELDDHVDNPQAAISFFSPPDVTGNTPQLLEMFRQSADDETGLGRIMDGSTGGTRKTAFEISRVMESGNKMIGGICRNHDEGLIEPMAVAWYHYHMICGNDDAIKGDYLIEARGFQSYQDKAVRAAKLMELAQFSLANQMTANYAKVGQFLRELARISDFDPDTLFYLDEEVEQRAAKLAGMLPGVAGVADDAA